jgi:hypothetical protein
MRNRSQKLSKIHPQHTDVYFNAFSLTLTANLTNNLTNGFPAGHNLSQHGDNFSAYWLPLPEEKFPTPTLSGFMHAANRGNAHQFWLDMRQIRHGRSFCITQRGQFALAPHVTEPGDLRCIIFAARVPFIIRKIGNTPKYRLVREAYIHQSMRGEVIQMIENDEIREEAPVLC